MLLLFLLSTKEIQKLKEKHYDILNLIIHIIILQTSLTQVNISDTMPWNSQAEQTRNQNHQYNIIIRGRTILKADHLSSSGRSCSWSVQLEYFLPQRHFVSTDDPVNFCSSFQENKGRHRCDIELLSNWLQRNRIHRLKKGINQTKQFNSTV